MTMHVHVLLPRAVILIHTSVKLVTHLAPSRPSLKNNFNPHEREARDGHLLSKLIAGHYFNPHEREARDEANINLIAAAPILIHTSVKLVTISTV